MTKKRLTDQQKAFLRELSECGDIRTAMNNAGYSKNYSVHDLMGVLKDEIIDVAERMLAFNAVKASLSMGHVMDNPTELGGRDKLAASKEILDRVGLSRRDRVDVNVTTPNGIFVLPAKVPTKRIEDAEDVINFDEEL